MPELGPVEPVLWDELEAGLDGVMLATGGVWLESAVDAVKAYPGLFTVDGLRSGRKGGGGVSLIGNPYKQNTTTSAVRYQRAGKGQRPARALAVMDPAAARAWLEKRLGPLVWFEVEGEAGGERPLTHPGNWPKRQRRTTCPPPLTRICSNDSDLTVPPVGK